MCWICFLVHFLGGSIVTMSCSIWPPLRQGIKFWNGQYNIFKNTTYLKKRNALPNFKNILENILLLYFILFLELSLFVVPSCIHIVAAVLFSSDFPSTREAIIVTKKDGLRTCLKVCVCVCVWGGGGGWGRFLCYRFVPYCSNLKVNLKLFS